MKLLRLPTLVLAACASLAACDGGTDPEDLERGEFEGRITGGFVLNIDGSAGSFGPTGSQQDELYMVDFFNNAEIAVINLDGVFFEGRVPIEDATDPALESGVGALVYFANTDRLFYSVDGSLDIQELTSEGATGSLSFDAVEVRFVSDNQFVVVGGEIEVQVDFKTAFEVEAGVTRIAPAAVRLKAKTAP